jgi:hypothetical protein
MVSKRLLVGPPYKGFPKSEEDARLLIRTYVASNLFRPSQQLDYKRLEDFIRSGHVLVYEENERGLEFWSDDEDWTFIAFEECFRVPTHPIKKEFRMMIGGIHYGAIACPTQTNNLESSLVRSTLAICHRSVTDETQTCGSRLKHRKRSELDPNMGKGPWEFIHLSAKGIDGALEMVELDPEVSTGPWEIIRSPAKDDDRKSEMVELEKEPMEFTVYDILHLRQQRYRGFELLVAQSCVPKLREALGDHYHLQRRVDPTTPNAGEVNVFGRLTAIQMAYRGFITTAVDVICNGWSEAGHFYLREAESHGLGTRLEIALQCEYYGQKVLHEDEKRISDNDDCLTIKG